RLVSADGGADHCPGDANCGFGVARLHEHDLNRKINLPKGRGGFMRLHDVRLEKKGRIIQQFDDNLAGYADDGAVEIEFFARTQGYVHSYRLTSGRRE